MPRSALGSIIGSYKKRRPKNKSEQHQIEQVVKRLEDYKNYQLKLYRQKQNKKRDAKSKTISTIKKIAYRKIKYKPLINPYIEMYKNNSRIPVPPDPNLLKQYKINNVYSYYTFKDLTLPRTGHNVKAGQAWGALIKSWKGYKIAKHKTFNDEHMKLYASATQKWAYCLELDDGGIPNFPDIGLSNLGFLNARFLKEYVKGYENEKIF